MSHQVTRQATVNSTGTLLELNKPPSATALRRQRSLLATSARLCLKKCPSCRKVASVCNCDYVWGNEGARKELNGDAFLIQFVGSREFYECLLKLGDYINDDPALRLLSFVIKEDIKTIGIFDPFTKVNFNEYVTLYVNYDVQWTNE